MGDPVFDAGGLFDEDYLYFYRAAVDETRSAAEVDLLWRMLGLTAGVEVLDLACGHGRISNRLAERGCVVTGLDATPLFLEHARRDAAQWGVNVSYQHGDMRDLPWAEDFDVIVNWFTSFGYFTDADNQTVLRQAFRALHPGGRLVIEVNNAVSLLRRYLPSSVTTVDADLMIDQHHLEPLTGRNITDRTIIRDGRARTIRYTVRMFGFPELRDWLTAAGFPQVDGYGEDGTPLHADHRRMIVIAHR